MGVRASVRRLSLHHLPRAGYAHRLHLTRLLPGGNLLRGSETDPVRSLLPVLQT